MCVLQVPEPPELVWFGNLNPAIADTTDEARHLQKLFRSMLGRFGPVMQISAYKLKDWRRCSTLVCFKYRSGAQHALEKLGDDGASFVQRALAQEVRSPCWEMQAIKKPLD